jgi:hypothetical protein
VDAALSYQSDTNTITDRVTGLVWAKQTLDGGVSIAEARSHCNALVGSNYGGRSDWRMPSVSELASIADYGRKGPAIDPLFAPTVGGLFWTSEAQDANSTYGVNFNLGAVFWYPNAGVGSTHARCVSGRLSGSFERTSCVPPTVIDHRTSLEWQLQAPTATLAWVPALAYCAALGDGWRLPNVKELLSLFAPASRPAYPSPFAGEPGVPFWTSTPVRESATGSFFVDFGPSRSVVEGAANEDPRSVLHRVRCVRNR